MFTAPDKLSKDESQVSLNYVAKLALQIHPDFDYDGETGTMCCYGSPLISRYIYRYNNSEAKSKKLGRLKTRLNEFLSNKDIEETLTFFELDIEKFWHLLLFVYDFSYNQCMNGIKPKSPLSVLQTVIDKVSDNTTTDSFRRFVFKEDMQVTFQIGKKKYIIDDNLTINRICSKLKEDINNDEWNLQSLDSLFKSETTESISVLAYAFYSHFISFFNTYQPITSKRKIKDSPSKREKQLICDLIYFTGIIQNESISTDPDYLKTLIKRYKDYQLPNGSFSY